MTGTIIMILTKEMGTIACYTCNLISYFCEYDDCSYIAMESERSLNPPMSQSTHVTFQQTWVIYSHVGCIHCSLAFNSNVTV
jgi:hypothetical protein